MNTNIYLVRHAHSIYTSDELNRPLSENGYRDAEKVTESLWTENIDTVLSSPYKRSIQTVEGIAKHIGAEVIIEDGFKERKIAEGLIKNFERDIIKLWTNPTYAFEGGESNLEAKNRGIHSLNEVLKRYNGKNIVIGTHGNIMVLIMNYFDSNYDYEFWKELSMPDIYKLSFDDNKLSGAKRIFKD
ncbi:histidine phosphatase family protein [Clostridium estertheticum]|uniref:histidine phosphatase family protein n=1 Tax=Clostridium estertheticum TaxID=238834 RepID=UPI0013E8FD6A|nr:histidine phosphatase family protein [Clostridium estertheticum]MBZ9689311.1 histidine phosphatase family protein [Clostridium estertheticum]